MDLCFLYNRKFHAYYFEMIPWRIWIAFVRSLDISSKMFSSSFKSLSGGVWVPVIEKEESLSSQLVFGEGQISGLIASLPFSYKYIGIMPSPTLILIT